MEVPLDSYPFVRKEYYSNWKHCPFKSFKNYCLNASSWNEFNRKYATDDRFEGSFALIKSRVWHLVSSFSVSTLFYYFESHSLEYFGLEESLSLGLKICRLKKSFNIGLESFGLKEVSVFAGKNAISANLIIQMWEANNLVSMSIYLKKICFQKSWSWIKVLDSV